jgi:hypothetical protein
MKRSESTAQDAIEKCGHRRSRGEMRFRINGDERHTLFDTCLSDEVCLFLGFHLREEDDIPDRILVGE